MQSLLVFGSESSLELNKRLRFHNCPWQLNPIQHCSWQKGVFEAVYISLVCDILLAVTSSGLSGLGDWVVFGGDLHEAVFHFVEELTDICCCAVSPAESPILVR